MVIDSSALVAILQAEAAGPALAKAIEDDSVRLVSAASLLETSIVIESRYREAGALKLDSLIRKTKLEVVAVSAEQAEIARDAWRRFGKGRHRANLNFGDCFSYALAKDRGERLLFVGEDFSKTDLECVPLN